MTTIMLRCCKVVKCGLTLQLFNVSRKPERKQSPFKAKITQTQNGYYNALHHFLLLGIINAMNMSVVVTIVITDSYFCFNLYTSAKASNLTQPSVVLFHFNTPITTLSTPSQEPKKHNYRSIFKLDNYMVLEIISPQTWPNKVYILTPSNFDKISQS